MVRAFEFSTSVEAFPAELPRPADLAILLTKLAASEQRAFLTLWISEGIPQAFKRAPMIYASARSFLAMRFGINEKNITMIGSGRTGFSLAPVPKYGRAFSQQSDLDFCAVSDRLFADCGAEFVRWKEDVRCGNQNPRTPVEEKYWKANLKRLPVNISRGFIDPHLIPYRYKEVRSIADALWLLKAKLAITANAPVVRKVSIRIYKDWSSFIDQNQLNLNYLLSSFRQ